MALNQIERVLDNFIINDHNDLITLCGKWGVGKTYFWKEIIKSQIVKNKKLKYSYVSLFGINSLETLKNAIIANQFQSNGIKGDKIKRIYAFIRNSVQRSPFIRNYTGNLIDEIIFSSIDQMIICFDDIERIGNGLSLKDFIGVVTQLKETKNCKIIIILNEASMKDDNSGEYKKHIEKVIDLPLKFDRTYDETLQCIFSHENKFFNFILEKCTKLELKNLRILQRINRYIKDLELDSLDLDNELLTDTINSIILFTFCYFDKDIEDEHPTFDFFRNFISEFKIMNEKLGEERFKKWYSFIEKYGYRTTNEIDYLLINYIENGFLDKQYFKDKLTKVNDEITDYQKLQEYHEVWYKFKNSFNQNQNDFINDLMTNYHNAFNSMDLKNLNSVVLILKALNKKEKAVEIMSNFFVNKAEDLKKEDTFYNPIPNDLDKEVKNLYLKTIKQTENIKPLDKILEKILNHGWSNKDEEMLDFYKVEDYFNLFLSDNENVGYYVSNLISWSKSPNDDFRVKAGKITVEALKKMCKESEFNKIKLQKAYDFNIEEG